MNANARRYLVIETASSVFCNAVLNFAGAYAVYHGHRSIPVSGSGSLVADTIGETSISVFLSALAALLISRHRRIHGKLPPSGRGKLPSKAGNPYLRALLASLVFTVICFGAATVLLPHIFNAEVSFRTVVSFKTVYGGLLGLVATSLYIFKSFDEYDVKPDAVMSQVP